MLSVKTLFQRTRPKKAGSPTRKKPKVKVEKIECVPSPTKKPGGKKLNEKECRRIFEKYFDKEFPSVFPEEIVNPETGSRLELDGYNRELQLAFEYNGMQHYVYPNCFHKTEEQFLSQIRRDAYKKNRCQSLGIHLVIIPYTIKFVNLEEFILKSIPNQYKTLISSSAIPK